MKPAECMQEKEQLENIRGIDVSKIGFILFSGEDPVLYRAGMNPD